MKMVGMLKRVKLRGIDKVGWLFTSTGGCLQPLPIAKPDGQSMTWSDTSRLLTSKNSSKSFLLIPAKIKFKVKGYSNGDFSASC
jgi:hypothetical protein